MITYVGNPKESTKKTLLELINHYGKVAGYQVNKQNQLFSYIPSMKNTIYISIPKNEILRYKSNKSCTESIRGKLQNIVLMKENKIQINGETCHVMDRKKY